MIVVKGFKGVKKMVKVSVKEEKRNLRRVRNLMFSKLMYGERDRVMLVLMGKLSRLRYEDLEEVYSDGCLVLWNKWNEKGDELEGENLVGYLVKICKNIGMHYLRKINEDVESLDVLMEKNSKMKNLLDEDGMMEMFDVIDDVENKEDEVYKKLDEIWEHLSNVDRMILESYYWDGCKMEDIARRIGYKSADSVKSKKNKVIKKMIEMMRKEEGSQKLPSFCLTSLIYEAYPLSGYRLYYSSCS